MYGRLVSPILRQALKRRNFSSSSGSIPQGVWNLGRLNHIAIATPDLPNSIALYRDVFRASVRYVLIDCPSMVQLNIFFIFLSAPEDLPDHGVTVVFIELDNTKIELLHPLGEKSPISGFLKKNPNGGMHHICIEVDDIKAAMKDLTAKNIQCLSDEPKIGAHGKPVSCVQKQQGGDHNSISLLFFISGSFYSS